MPREGFLTPSTFADLMSNGRGKDSMGKTALSVVNGLVLDLLGVEPQQRSTPTSCQWGLDQEWSAVRAYEEETFRTVREAEFRVSSTHDYVGGTMDGLIGDIGGIEVKSPYNTEQHLHNLREAKQLYDLYWYQVQGYFWIYQLEWIDFVSFDPRFPEKQRLAIHRVVPDLATIEQLKARCELAYKMALDEIEKLNAS